MIELGADVAPPSLRVADKIDFRVGFEYPRETLQPRVVGFVLEMHEYWHAQFLRKLVDAMHLRRVHGDVELELADADGAAVDVAGEEVHGSRFRGIGASETPEALGIAGFEGGATGIIADHREHPAFARQENGLGYVIRGLV